MYVSLRFLVSLLFSQLSIVSKHTYFGVLMMCMSRCGNGISMLFSLRVLYIASFIFAVIKNFSSTSTQ